MTAFTPESVQAVDAAITSRRSLRLSRAKVSLNSRSSIKNGPARMATA